MVEKCLFFTVFLLKSTDLEFITGYRRRIEAEDFLYCTTIAFTDFYDYVTFFSKKVKFIF